MKIVSDSSSNVFSLDGGNYSAVPMKINAGDREFLDLPGLDVEEMVLYLKEYKGRSGSSCPNVGEWTEAFGTQGDVFAVTISGNLSGSFNAASQVARELMEEDPGRKAHVFDSKSAGPEQRMIAEKIQECIARGLTFEQTREETKEYFNHTHTLFCLESMMNLARNGRVNIAVAKIAGMLGIRVVGEAQDGRIEVIEKPRGEKRTLETMAEQILKRGLFDGAKVCIAHCFARRQAETLAAILREKCPGCRIFIEPTTALCSYYAEWGGLIVGFEGGRNEVNHY